MTNSYTLMNWVPYGGYSDVMEGGLEDIKKFLQGKSKNELYGYIIYSNDAPDVEELMKE